MKIPSGERDEICRAVHAEQNAIIQCAVLAVCCVGATMYCTNMPCTHCAKTIISAGVSKVIFVHGYNAELSIKMFETSDSELIQWQGPTPTFDEEFLKTLEVPS